MDRLTEDMQPVPPGPDDPDPDPEPPEKPEEKPAPGESTGATAPQGEVGAQPRSPYDRAVSATVSRTAKYVACG